MASSKGKIFFAEVPKGFLIKGIIDVLSLPLSRGYLTFDEKGIFLRQTDNGNIILLDIALYREHLKKFKCIKPMTISINLKQVQKQLKNVKKKDCMILYIEPNTKHLCMTIRPEGPRKMSRFETIKVIFQEVPNYKMIELPDGKYKYPMVIDAADFQKIKKLTTVGKIINVKIQASNYISFNCDAGDIFSNELGFGEMVDDEDEKSNQEIKDGDEHIPNLYTSQYHSSTLNMLVKLPSLCNQMQFYSPGIPRFPLKIRLDASQSSVTIGIVQVFIKDVQQIAFEESMRNEENCTVISSKKKKKKV